MVSVTKNENFSSMGNTRKAQDFNAQGFQGDMDDSKSKLYIAVNRAGRRVREFISHAGDEISNARDTVTSQIRTNPLQSSLAALGVGFIIGTLFRR